MGQVGGRRGFGVAPDISRIEHYCQKENFWPQGSQSRVNGGWVLLGVGGGRSNLLVSKPLDRVR